MNIFLDAATVFYAILIEALPFIVLGIVISALLSVFVRDETILKFIPKNTFFGHATIAFLGVLFPVCECGNIPLARRLISKGVPPSQAITFLLAAPVVNPVVILATYTAFGSIAKEIVIVRVLASYAIAVLVGLFFALYKNQESLLQEKFVAFCAIETDTVRTKQKRLLKFSRLVVNETIGVLAALLIGSLIAAAISMASRQSIIGLAHSPLTAILVMMVLAFIMTICSTVDAFVALGFVTAFPLGAVLAFLIFGPMVDMRSLSIMSTTFKSRTLVVLVLVIAEFVVLTSIGYSFFLG